MPLTLDANDYFSAVYHTFFVSAETLRLFARTTTEAVPAQCDVNRIRALRSRTNTTAEEVPVCDVNRIRARGISLEQAKGAKDAVPILAYACIASIVKEMAKNNQKNIFRQIKAVGSDLNKQAWMSMTESQCMQYVSIQILNEMRKNLLKDNAHIELVRDVLKSDTLNDGTDAPPHIKALVGSLHMIYKGHGMTAFQEMSNFCKIVTRALLEQVVLNEAIAFKDALDEFKRNHGDLWEYGYVFKLHGIESLNVQKFPHLYVCSIARATAHSATFENYTESQVVTRISKQKLAIMANRDISE